MKALRSFLIVAEKTLSEIRWPKYFILIGGLLSTMFVTYYLHRIEYAHRVREFEYICRDASTRILTRLQSHELVLKTAAAFFESSDSVTFKDWQDFVTKSDITEILPDIRNIGYSAITGAAGNGDLLTSILYLEPSDPKNLHGVGYDMFTEAECRKAMQIARDSDITTLATRFDLNNSQAGTTQAGLIMFTPVFSKDKSFATLAERKAAIRGWTFNPFRMDELVYGIQGLNYFLEEAGIQLKIFSGSTSGLLYESRNFDESAGRRTEYSISIGLKFNNSDYVLRFNKNHDTFILSSRGIIILASGVIITLLVFLLILLLINTGKNARMLALQLTSKLKSREQDLIRINATKDKLYSIIAHDLRSPFNAIIGLTDIIAINLEKKDTEKAAMLNKLVNSNAEQTLILLENLLEWTKSQTGQIEFRPAEHLLSPVIRKVVDVLNTAASVKGICLADMTESENMQVYADLPMLEIILRNLISNAIKFTDQGGKIQIYACEKQGFVEITVEDNGRGMQSEILEKLFKTDSAVSTYGTSQEKGSGLGLILCREFVEKNGGRIHVESMPGSGSKFTFSVPGVRQPGTNTKVY